MPKKGEKMPQEQRDKISKTRIDKGLAKGGNNPMSRPEVREKHRKSLGSQEVKDKISKSRTGVPLKELHKQHIKENSNPAKGKDHYLFGKHLPPEHLQHVIDGSPHISGKDHWNYGNFGALSPNWQGGLLSLSERIRKSEKYIEWKISVFIRDNRTCQHCKDETKSDIQAHHIKLFSLIIYENNITSLEEALLCSELWNINNGITLCETCHDKKPKKYKLN